MTRRVWIIPGVVVVFTILGLVGARHLSIPTFVFVFDEGHTGETASIELTVQGVRCYGTANLLREHISEVPGLVSMVAYGGRHRVALDYDPARTDPGAIRNAIEQPLMMRTGPARVFSVTAWKKK